MITSKTKWFILALLVNTWGCQAKSPASGDDLFLSYPENPWSISNSSLPPIGQLDDSFSSSTAGILELPLDKTNIWAHGNQILPLEDGKILVVGNQLVTSGIRMGSTDFKVMRLNEDGSLDTSFNSASNTPGIYTFDLNLTAVGTSIESTHVAIQKGQGIDKIIVAGTIDTNTSNYLGVIRLNMNGTLDASFGTSGISTVTINGTNNLYLQSLLIQSTGKIILGGYGYDATVGLNKVALARLNEDGSLDSSFNSAGSAPGIYFNNLGCNCSILAYEFKLNGDDKIWLGGERSLPYTSFIGKFTADGVLDTNPVSGYNNGLGFVTLPHINHGLTSFGINSQQEVILTGWSNSSGQIYISKIKSDGTLDSSFGTNGINNIYVASDDWGTHAEFAPDGKILIMHSPRLNGHYRTAITRLNSNGSLDTTFGNLSSTPGMYLFEKNGNHLENVSMIVLPDQKILVASHNQSSSNQIYLFKIK